MTKAYLLWHVRSDDEFKEDAKLIGAYSSDNAATQAIKRLKDQPGFIDHPQGFEIDAYEIDKDHWTEGFVTC